MLFYFYHIINIINQYEYIGITQNFEQRKKEHFTNLEKNRHTNWKLQADWNKYGPTAFKCSILESKEYENTELAYQHEYDLIHSSEKYLYNLAPGGRVNPMYSDEIKKKMIATKQAAAPNLYQLEEIDENVFKVIKIWNSQKEAQREGNFHQGNISHAIQGHTKMYGYYWVNEEDIINNLANWEPARTKMTPYAHIDQKGDILESHHNGSVFEQKYGYKPGGVAASVRQGTRYHGKRFIKLSKEQYYQLHPITLVQ